MGFSHYLICLQMQPVNSMYDKTSHFRLCAAYYAYYELFINVLLPYHVNTLIQVWVYSLLSLPETYSCDAQLSVMYERSPLRE